MFKKRDKVKFKSEIIQQHPVLNSDRLEVSGFSLTLYFIVCRASDLLGERPTRASEWGKLRRRKAHSHNCGRQEAPIYIPTRGTRERRKLSHRNFEHLIPNGVHFGLLFTLKLSKVGGDRPTLF